MEKNAIKLCNVTKKFGTTVISNGVTLEIPEGKMTVIIGRSGEGKSVLLKQIVGLIPPTSGSIYINDINITTSSEKDFLQATKNVGYVFQFAALLDSLTVFENVGITLLEQKKALESVEEIVRQKLTLVNLDPDTTMNKYPSELSGGMRKRVGLARTLVTQPSIILYDEPTTGLDPVTTTVIHELMSRMQKSLGVTSLVVSHDIEIFKYADYVALLYEGQIKYFGPASTIWQSENEYVYQFIRGQTVGPIGTDLAQQE
ncbi:hypothetical protein J120_00265 [candidate division TM6 bacterium JCVI TM6SC1]|jgi:phospholipid/cholesterol/gamma-HCH transport system ATP-binding protein|uniref:ABC transporter domain-containing protein n=1 Tax=candidate division TM6 bacterium JCVI TM6SC1 TaxID=1306947 RepID=A0A0D2K586_9BACT|nr:hypothetical protein J120_00265 [candidate division TM6 bacterium JCVI TM6SC1]